MISEVQRTRRLGELKPLTVQNAVESEFGVVV